MDILNKSIEGAAGTFGNEDFESSDNLIPNTNLMEETKTELFYPIGTDNGDKLYCQICGKLFVSITQSHLKSHDITVAEYKKKFDTPVLSPQGTLRLKVAMTKKYQGILEQKNKEEIKEEIKVDDSITMDDIIDIGEAVEDIKFDQGFNDLKDINHTPTETILYKKSELCYELEEILDNVDVIENYLIETSSGHGTFPGTTMLQYSYITDIAIPSKQIAFFFPDTFWHNTEKPADPTKYSKLKNDGWCIIEVTGNNPSIKSIKEKLIESKML